MNAANTARDKPPRGRLLMICTPLGDAPLNAILPHAVITQAALTTHWIAENAKSCRAFIKQVGEHAALAQPLQAMSIQELPKHQALSRDAARALLAPALAGHDIALVSEAGAPGVADPGAIVAAAAHELGVDVLPAVGPSSLLLALMASGLNGQQFAFHGYLPKDTAARNKQLAEMQLYSHKYQQTQLFIETPYRNVALWQALLAALKGDVRLCVAVGLTTPAQYVHTQTVARWREQAALPPIDGVPTVFAFLA